MTKGQCNTNDWRNIIAVSAYSGFTMGLKADGTVVAVGGKKEVRDSLKDWQNIIAISAGSEYAAGLRADGTVLTTVQDEKARKEIESWYNISLSDKQIAALKKNRESILMIKNNMLKSEEKAATEPKPKKSFFSKFFGI